MKQKKDINQLLKNYFEQEQHRKDSELLQKKIAQQIKMSPAINWTKWVLPIAASLLLIVGISIFMNKQKFINKQLAKEDIIYEDSDLLIYYENE